MYPSSMDITDASGNTSLHLLIERRMEMFNSMSNAMSENENFYKKLQKQIQENDKMINMLLENTSSDNECLDNIGLSNFHVACMLQDTSIAENLADRITDINHCVNKDSKLWPGYTALHFASHFNVNTVKMLMMKGADMEIKDSKGLTPLDICIERYEIDDVRNIISLNEKWKDIVFSDGKTKLVSFIRVMANFNGFEQFIKKSIKNINMFIPMESILWSGYTTLHLALLFADRSKLLFIESRDKRQEYFKIIKLCLNEGADLSIQDSHGRTPFHLAFRLEKMNVVYQLFQEYNNKIPNVSDEDNLSHLHIACAGNRKGCKLNKCVINKSVVNVIYKGTLSVNTVQPGWTPLHVCLAEPRKWDSTINSVINFLLKHGADIYIKDAYSLTPIHWLLNCYYYSNELFQFRPLADKLLKKAPIDCVADKYGISYLHIACLADNDVAVKRFLDNDADVNVTIEYTQRDEHDSMSFLSRYEKYTPLHIIASRATSMRAATDAVCKLLLNHGADVFSKRADGLTPLASSKILDPYISKVWSDPKLQEYVRREFGWTKLHLACHLLEFDGFSNIVKTELANINSQVYSNSPIWKGYTPLHIMVRRNHCLYDKFYTMLKILLKKGADVMKLNDEQKSPLNIMFIFSDRVRKYAGLLMKYQKNFDVNPVDKYGVSHFHVACYLNDVDAVKGFLKNGVDINHSADLLSRVFSIIEYIPLHMATDFPVIELLIKHGADVHKQDLKGCTVLHKAVKRARYNENVIAKIIESGAKINKPDFHGKTPFETAIFEGEITIEKLKFFIKHGFLVNSCNWLTGVGYLTIMARYYRDQNLQRTLIEMMMKEKSVNNFGRNTIHHLVTTSYSSSMDYVDLFEKLIKSRHDIDEQDSEGKTALHIATEYRNSKAVCGLLACGADVNILDNTDNSPLSYAFSQSTQKPYEIKSVNDLLTLHACRLFFLKLNVDQVNKDSLVNVCQSINDKATSSEFLEQVALSKEIKVGVRSMRLYDFLSETGAVTIYPMLNQLERSQIDEYFENLKGNDKLTEIRSFLMLQYRKAVERANLFFAAMESLRWLLGFNFPDLCVENVFQYLRNSDLKNIIAAQTETEKIAMDVD